MRQSLYRVTSPADAAYNCIAWAAGATSCWWWPFGDPSKTFWPEGVTRAQDVHAFRDAFASLGYVACPHSDLETGFDKIAIFVDADGFPTHMARQLSTGRWTSKLGKREDIEHALAALQGKS